MHRAADMIRPWILTLLCVAALAACSSTPSGSSGPDACRAAGGTCVIGPGTGCATVGPQDCNPDRNPGGAICCLQQATADGAGDATADAAAADAGVTPDAPDGHDAGTVSKPFCAATLSPSAPVTLGAVPWAAWCASNPNRVGQWSCGGVVAVTIGIGVDCHERYYFDATSSKLLAISQGCIGEACMAGNPDFRPPAACVDGSTPMMVTNVCAEKGLTTTPPPGAGDSCSSDGQCPPGYRCGYFGNGGCGSQGQCIYGTLDQNPTCTPQTLCACDGTTTKGCVGISGGVAFKPVSPNFDQRCVAPDGGG
jgi:hypothetical protein